MTVPSKNWTNIADTQVDADSPIDSTLITAIRDDLVHLKEWLGYGFTAAQAHNHDGFNSAGATVADAAISLAKLKMTQGSYNAFIAGSSQVAVQLSRYGHHAVVGASNSSPVYWYYEGTGGVNTSGNVLRVVGNNTNAAGQTAHITWDYHAA